MGFGGVLKDYQEYVRRWNKNSARTFQISGQRATSLKLLFECAPLAVVSCILGHVGRLSFSQCVWTDDNLSSKRMYTGHQFSAKGKKWLARLRVTHESMMLHVERMQTAHESIPTFMRRKPTMAEVASCAEKAAACYHLGAELLNMLPIKPAVIKSFGSSLNEWCYIFYFLIL